MVIPKSRLDTFRRDQNLRLGQALHNHLELHKVTNREDAAWCDKLWNADDVIAAEMIRSVTDYNN